MMRTFVIFPAILGLCVFLSSCDSDDVAGGGSGGSSVTITTTTLLTGLAGISYSQAIQTNGGSGSSFSWNTIVGSLPAGLSLTAGTPNATLNGTTTQLGTHNFTLEVMDSLGGTDTQAFSLTIVTPAPLTVGILPPSNGSIGSFYQSTFTASGGTGTGYTWSVTSGSLPPGLHLISGTPSATISGTPTTDNTYNFTLEVMDSASNSDTVSHTITISTTTLTIANPAALDYGVMGYEYFQQFNAVGSTASLTWQMTAGTLPNGIAFDAAGAALIGVPTQTGSFAFTLEVDDTTSTHQRNFSLVIRPSAGALSITTLHIGSWLVGEPVMDPLESIGGSGTGYVWATAAGVTLPNGISISNGGSSSMAGTPTQAGTFTFTLEVTDSAASVETRTFTVDIWSATPDFYTKTLTDNSVFVIAAESTMSGSRIASLRSELVTALSIVPSSWSIDVVAHGSQFTFANNFNTKCFGNLTRMTAARKWEIIEFVLGASLNSGAANSMYSALQDVSTTYPTTLQSLFVTAASSPSTSGSASQILADSPNWFAGFANITMHFFTYGGGSVQQFMQQMAALHSGTYTAV